MTKKQKTNLIRILVSAVLVAAIWLSPLTGWLEGVLYLIPYFIIGYDILLKAVKGIFRGQVFDENFLMAVATVGAIALALYEGSGDYTEAIAVMLFYQIGELFQSVAVGKSRRIRTGSTPPPNAGNDPLPLDRTFRLHRTASNAGSGPPATAIAARRDPERRLRRRMQDAARPAGSAGILPYKFRSAVQNRQTAYPRPGRSSSGKAPL